MSEYKRAEEILNAGEVKYFTPPSVILHELELWKRFPLTAWQKIEHELWYQERLDKFEAGMTDMRPDAHRRVRREREKGKSNTPISSVRTSIARNVQRAKIMSKEYAEKIQHLKTVYENLPNIPNDESLYWMLNRRLYLGPYVSERVTGTHAGITRGVHPLLHVRWLVLNQALGSPSMINTIEVIAYYTDGGNWHAWNDDIPPPRSFDGNPPWIVYRVKEVRA